MKFNASISDKGELKINNRDNYDKYIESLKGKAINIEINKKRKIRSLNQNALYWLWMSVLQDTGYTADEFHTMFRSMFLTDNTKKFPIVRSTTKLSTLDFTIYLGKIAQYCSENEVLKDIILPDPNSEELI